MRPWLLRGLLAVLLLAADKPALLDKSRPAPAPQQRCWAETVIGGSWAMCPTPEREVKGA